MSFLQKPYPFEPANKQHFIIALCLASWIFVFLNFTEPLDVNEFNKSEKLLYLPLYGLLGGLMYIFLVPFQAKLYKLKNSFWSIQSELLFLFVFILEATIVLRVFYLMVVVPNEPNPYSFSYQLTNIILPAIATILPFVIVARYGFGKYREKKLEKTKIEIKGEGTYDGLKLFLEDLICIQSSDNYVEISYLSGKEVKKSLVRNKLSVLSEELSELIRVHRSYIVNPIHFIQYKTEKGKLYLELTNSIFTPVSNTYKNEVKAVLNSTTNS